MANPAYEPCVLIVDDTDEDVSEILHVACDAYTPRESFLDGGAF